MFDRRFHLKWQTMDHFLQQAETMGFHWIGNATNFVLKLILDSAPQSKNQADRDSKPSVLLKNIDEEAQSPDYLEDFVKQVGQADYEVISDSIRLIKSHVQEIPENVFQLGGLVNHISHMDLSENLIKFIPSSIGNLGELKILNLADNKIEYIPEEIGKLTKLEELYLGNNQLKFVPIELAQCQRLKVLDVSFNELSVLPSELGSNNLERMDVEHNLWIEPFETLFSLLEEPGMTDLGNASNQSLEDISQLKPKTKKFKSTVSKTSIINSKKALVLFKRGKSAMNDLETSTENLHIRSPTYPARTDFITKSFSFTKQDYPRTPGTPSRSQKRARHKSLLAISRSKSSIFGNSGEVNVAIVSSSSQLNQLFKLSHRYRLKFVLNILKDISFSKEIPSNDQLVTHYSAFLWHSTVLTMSSNNSNDNSKKSKVDLENVITEIISTEKNYIEYLEIVKDCFIDPLSRKTNELLTSQEMEQMFLNWTQILDFHKKFFHPKISRLNESNEISTLLESLAESFIQGSPILIRLYSEFVTKCGHSISLFHTHYSKKKKFKYFYDGLVNARKDKKILPNLEFYLLMPVQRIPRYILLMENLCKTLELDAGKHLEKYQIQLVKTALQSLKTVSSEINEQKKYQDMQLWAKKLISKCQLSSEEFDLKNRLNESILVKASIFEVAWSLENSSEHLRFSFGDTDSEYPRRMRDSFWTPCMFLLFDTSSGLVMLQLKPRNDFVSLDFDKERNEYLLMKWRIVRSIQFLPTKQALSLNDKAQYDCISIDRFTIGEEDDSADTSCSVTCLKLGLKSTFSRKLKVNSEFDEESEKSILYISDPQNQNCYNNAKDNKTNRLTQLGSWYNQITSHLSAV